MRASPAPDRNDRGQQSRAQHRELRRGRCRRARAAGSSTACGTHAVAPVRWPARCALSRFPRRRHDAQECKRGVVPLAVVVVASGRVVGRRQPAERWTVRLADDASDLRLADDASDYALRVFGRGCVRAPSRSSLLVCEVACWRSPHGVGGWHDPLNHPCCRSFSSAATIRPGRWTGRCAERGQWRRTHSSSQTDDAPSDGGGRILCPPIDVLTDPAACSLRRLDAAPDGSPRGWCDRAVARRAGEEVQPGQESLPHVSHRRSCPANPRRHYPCVLCGASCRALWPAVVPLGPRRSIPLSFMAPRASLQFLCRVYVSG